MLTNLSDHSSKSINSNMDYFTFSIITAVYNEEKSVLKTLQTVRSQILNNNTNFSIEHIVVDGVSTDKSVDIIKDFILENSSLERISYKFISEIDNGIYDAMEKGRCLASGNFIFFLNSGDTFSSADTLEKVYYHILRSGSLNQVNYGNVIITSKFNTWKRPYKTPSTDRYHRFKDVESIPHHQSVFFPQEFYEKQGYDTNFIKFGDTDYVIRACELFPASYCCIDITQITLGGFSTKKHSYKEAWNIYKDFLRLSNNHPRKFSKFSVMSNFFKHLLKYLIDLSLGSDFKHTAMSFVARLRGFS